MVWKRTLERWETKLVNCKVTPQTIWPIVKSLTKRGGQKAPSAIYGPIGPISHPIDKTNTIPVCLENQFRAVLCDCDHKQHVKGKVKAMLAIIDEDTLLISDPVRYLKKYNPRNQERQVELVLLCSRIIAIHTRQIRINVVFSENSLQ
jgi:hypothetical protein